MRTNKASGVTAPVPEHYHAGCSFGRQAKRDGQSGVVVTHYDCYHPGCDVARQGRRTARQKPDTSGVFVPHLGCYHVGCPAEHLGGSGGDPQHPGEPNCTYKGNRWLMA